MTLTKMKKCHREKNFGIFWKKYLDRAREIGDGNFRINGTPSFNLCEIERSLNSQIPL